MLDGKVWMHGRNPTGDVWTGQAGFEDTKLLLENHLVTLLQQSTLDYSFCGKVKVFAFEIVP